ncbi:CG30 [Alphabaculovirus myunipunctae]|uniref:CG30 n=1 Tax=Mythimna unipuncta nucleopolyhedrovirus TaxID=447897 RepID=A0A2K9VSB7_9ABAC|nr:CG30 [Mythimna unipuncta nucleopolyhedrovirus]AUV65355.1 CG30 [Mythimna unipuncta nucleopolyhedrovirus]
MESVTIQCAICFNEVRIDRGSGNGEPMYVAPLVTLVNCGHHFCVSCVKSLTRTRSITCPTCRRINTKIRVICVNDSNVHCIESCVSNIRAYPTNNCPLNLAELVGTIFSTNVQDESSEFTSSVFTSSVSTSSVSESQVLSAEAIDDSVMENVAELSRLQAEIDTLRATQTNALDLAEQLETSVAALKRQENELKVALKRQENEMKATVISKRIEIEELQRKQTAAERKLSDLVRSQELTMSVISSTKELNETLKKQNTFLIEANKKLKADIGLAKKRKADDVINLSSESDSDDYDEDTADSDTDEEDFINFKISKQLKELTAKLLEKQFKRNKTN